MNNKVLVSIAIPNEKDLEVMKDAVKMLESFTTLPVIAVPLRSSFLDGLDSVLSILQMPIGVPVATVSVNGARNAAILACQMLSLHNENVRHQLDKLKTSLAGQVKQEATNVRSKSSIT